MDTMVIENRPLSSRLLQNTLYFPLYRIAGIFRRANFSRRPFWLYYSNYLQVKFLCTYIVPRKINPFSKTKDWPGNGSCSLGTDLKYWSNAVTTQLGSPCYATRGPRTQTRSMRTSTWMWIICGLNFRGWWTTVNIAKISPPLKISAIWYSFIGEGKARSW